MTSGKESPPVCYITLGGAGSGKSTLAKHLSILSGAVYLDKDSVAGPLVRLAMEAFEQDPSDRESNPLYVSRIMPAEYETLFDVAGRNLEIGHSVVLDAPFVAYLDDPDFLQRATEKAAWPSALIRVLHINASPEVVRHRLIERGNERDRAKLGNWDAYWARYGELRCLWRTGEHVFLTNDDESAFDRLRQVIPPGHEIAG
ncbi:AAA family ATPase [Microbacterium aurantiacum]|uniref:AAA family ATPase n=1 Tax=Microbacterium aurantiacum TaxID=162393 RepID=UPI004036C373